MDPGWINRAFAQDALASLGTCRLAVAYPTRIFRMSWLFWLKYASENKKARQSP